MSGFLLRDDIDEGVCRIIDIPWREVSGVVEIPILAGHFNRINKILVRATDGSSTIETTVSQRSTYTGYKRKLWCYVASLDFSQLNDGVVTVVAYTIPNIFGKSRKTSITYLNVSSNGVVPGTTIYCKAISGNDTNDGLTANTPVKSLHVAFERLANNTPKWGTILLDEEGTYVESINPSQSIVEDTWIVLKPGPSVSTASNVIITSNADTTLLNFKTKRLKITGGLKIDHATLSRITVDSGNETWLEGITWFDSRGRSNASGGGHNSLRNVDGNVYVVDCVFRDCANGPNGSKLIVDCDVDTIVSDCFTLAECVVNSTVFDVDKLSTTAHPDVLQFFLDRYENRAYSGIRAVFIAAQGIFQEGGSSASYRDVLYENCVFATKSGVSFTSQCAGITHGMIIEHCTFYNHNFNFRADFSSSVSNFNGSHIRFTNCATSDFVVLGTMKPIDGASLFEGCISENPPENSNWATVAQPGYMDAANWDFRPKDSSSAIFENGVAVSAQLLPPGSDGVGDPAKPNVGAWGDAAGNGFSGGVYTNLKHLKFRRRSTIIAG